MPCKMKVSFDQKAGGTTTYIFTIARIVDPVLFNIRVNILDALGLGDDALWHTCDEGIEGELACFMLRLAFKLLAIFLCAVASVLELESMLEWWHKRVEIWARTQT